MPAPLVGAAAAAAARLVAKKLAKDTAKKSVKKVLKTAKKSKPLAEPKSAVRVKPAAKQKPNSPNAAKANYKAGESRGRAYVKSFREYEKETGRYGNPYEQQSAAQEAAMTAKIGRKTNIQGRKLNEAEARKATTPVVKGPVAWSTKTPIKINTDPTKPKGVFGPLKKKIAAKSPEGRANVKANARGLKAANKPTNKVGSKADKLVRKQTKAVRLSKDEEATLYDYYYGTPNATQTLSRRVPKNDARSVRKMPKKSK